MDVKPEHEELDVGDEMDAQHRNYLTKVVLFKTDTR